MSRQPSGFAFEPSLAIRPAKRRAIITTLFVATPDYRRKLALDSDWFFTGAFLHAYSFLHDPVTKISPGDDAEFVVMITKLVPREYRRALIDLGARLLEVPLIEIEGRKKLNGDKYQYLYTKLNMYRLENIYDSILFLDVDLFFFRESPMPLFNLINSADFFGSTAEWKEGYGTFNSGLQLIKPSENRYQTLIALAHNSSYARYGDQGLLNKYFHPNGAHPVTLLPQSYNTHHLEERNETEIARGIGFHAKFWSECHMLSDASKPMWKLWQEKMVALRGIQMRTFESRSGYENATIVPAVPKTCEEWKEMQKLKGGMFLKWAIVSTGVVKKEVLESRSNLAQQFNEASHLYFPSPSQNGERLLLSKLRLANRLFDRYDWLWFPTESLKYSRPTSSFLIILSNQIRAEQPHIVTFRDCHGGKIATASFFITRDKNARKKLKTFLTQLDAGEFGAVESDEDALWEKLLYEYTKAGGERSLKVMEPISYVERIPVEECDSLLTSDGLSAQRSG
ncbi:nucleotide-diphospho-sugar transferase [Chytriomyces sp. MP71]|nr:nucleotide-diphospho-sugar transferase [Chytriomyces sp. MP71]